MKLPFTKTDKQPKIIIEEDIHLPIHIYIENRKNSRISILKENINIRLPKFLSSKQINQETTNLLKWAKKRIETKSNNPASIKTFNYWKDRNLELYDGAWTLNYIEYPNSKSVIAKIDELNRTITFKGSFQNKTEEEINEYSRSLIIQICKKHYHYKVYQLLMQINDKTLKKSVESLKLKHVTTRWGSCSSKKNINIAIRLLLTPQPCVEYVILHELAHLIEMNHSSKFWDIVEKHMPDYKIHEKWLKTEGRYINF